MSTFDDFMIDETVRKNAELGRLRAAKCELTNALKKIDDACVQELTDGPCCELGERRYLLIRNIVHAAIRKAEEGQ